MQAPDHLPGGWTWPVPQILMSLVSEAQKRLWFVAEEGKERDGGRERERVDQTATPSSRDFLSVGMMDGVAPGARGSRSAVAPHP